MGSPRMVPSDRVADVIVIGGGPAGTTVATLLAQRGHEVLLFERERFPREHVGESLLPYCHGIFEELGVLDVMERTMVRKPGVRFIDSDGITYTDWCFSAVITGPERLSFHVRRDRFDMMLLRNAEANGAEVHEETRVMSVDLDRPDGLVAIEAAGPSGTPSSYLGRFVVDASGRDTFMANRMGWKKKNPELDRTALSRHWIDAPLIGGLEEGMVEIVYLGGDKKGWLWMIPVGFNRVSVGVVVGSEYYRARRQQLLDKGVDDWKQALYRGEIATSPFASQVLATATPVTPLFVNGDYSYKCATKFGPRFAMIGDAHSFIDPIFSSGVFLSMNSARYVFRALDPWLSGDTGDPGPDLGAAYAHIEGAYALVEKAIKLFYNPAAINFAQAGSAADLIHERHQNALASLHYVIAGDFFERHEEYARVFDLLAEPAMFAKFKKFVLDRPGFEVTSGCGNRDDAFSAFLRSEVEPSSADVDLLGVSSPV